MYPSQDRLIIFDADGTVIDAYRVIALALQRIGMNLGDLSRFQARHGLFKYMGGLREFPRNLALHIGKYGRNALLTNLTEVYREEAQFYPGVASLLQQLLDQPDIRVGMVTRNVSFEPAVTLARIFARHGLDIQQLDFVNNIPLDHDKATSFKAARARLGINPAHAFVCGDEYKDFSGAIASGMHPFIVSYGFESPARLTRKFGIPAEIISATPADLIARIRHTFNIETPTKT